MYEIALIISVSCLLLFVVTIGLPTYFSLKNVHNPRERAFTLRLAAWGAVFCFLLTAYIYFCIYAILYLGPAWIRYVWVSFLIGGVVYPPCLILLIRISNRSLARIRIEENETTAG
jgi:hypothetical protein